MKRLMINTDGLNWTHNGRQLHQSGSKTPLRLAPWWNCQILTCFWLGCACRPSTRSRWTSGMGCLVTGRCQSRRCSRCPGSISLTLLQSATQLSLDMAILLLRPQATHPQATLPQATLLQATHLQDTPSDIFSPSSCTINQLFYTWYVECPGNGYRSWSYS